MCGAILFIIIKNNLIINKYKYNYIKFNLTLQYFSLASHVQLTSKYIFSSNKTKHDHS